jgi:hypothetical protein
MRTFFAAGGTVEFNLEFNVNVSGAAAVAALCGSPPVPPPFSKNSW